MTIVEQRTVTNGQIDFDYPLPLPDGSKVIVQTQPGGVAAPSLDEAKLKKFAEAFPFIGQWADRTVIPVSAE